MRAKYFSKLEESTFTPFQELLYSTKVSSPQSAGKKRKVAASKGKPDTQAIREFKCFYNITFILGGKNG